MSEATNTDKTVSAEDLRKMLAAIPRHADGSVRSAAWVGRVPAPTLEAILTELLASRTQEPADWQDGFVAEYEVTNAVEAYRHAYPDGSSRAGRQGMRAALEGFAYRRAASITPPAPERSKEEVGNDERLLAALNWALGCADDFRLREDGEGAYWWRKELAERAGLVFDKGTCTYRLSALEPASLHKGEAVFISRAFDPMTAGSFKPAASPAPLPVGVTDEDWLRRTAMDVMLATEVDEAVGILRFSLAALSKSGEQG